MIKQWVLGASTLALSVAALAGGPAPVVSGQPYATQFYVEGHGGMTWQNWEGQQSTLTSLVTGWPFNPVLQTPTWKNGKHRGLYGASAGWKFLPKLAIEVGYRGYTDASYSGKNYTGLRGNRDQFDLDGKIQSSLFYAGVRYRVLTVSRFTVYATAAVARSLNKYDWTRVEGAAATTVTGNNKVNFTTLMGALGVHFALSQRLYVGAQVMYVPGKSGDFKVPAQTSADGFIGFNF